MGDADEADRLYAESIETFREIGDHWGVAHATSQAGAGRSPSWRSCNSSRALPATRLPCILRPATGTEPRACTASLGDLSAEDGDLRRRRAPLPGERSRIRGELAIASASPTCSNVSPGLLRTDRSGLPRSSARRRDSRGRRRAACRPRLSAACRRNTSSTWVDAAGPEAVAAGGGAGPSRVAVDAVLHRAARQRLGPFPDLDQAIGQQSVCLAVHILGRLRRWARPPGRRPFRRLVVPVAQ